MAKDKQVWDSPNPKSKSKKLAPKAKASAKAMAKAAGRPYPNLIDNMRAAKKKKQMSKETGDSFSGFMPMIDQIQITKETTMLNTEGELVKAHTFQVKARDGSDYVFSIDNYDLMRLSFLIMKVLSQD